MSVKDKVLTLLNKYASQNKDISVKEDSFKKDMDELEKKASNIEIRKAHDYEQRISVEIIAEPNTPDAHGHWYRPETIEKGFVSFDNAWRAGKLPMNLYHGYDDKDAEHLELVKHYIVPFDCEINGECVKEGTWVSEIKWHNEALFKQRTTLLEDGSTLIGGVSIKGWGAVNAPENS